VDSARRRRHNLQDDNSCAPCGQSSETLEHLLLRCVFSRELWFNLLCPAGQHQLTPCSDSKFPEWWLTAPKRLIKELRQGFDTFFILVTWSIWLECNAESSGTRAGSCRASSLRSEMRASFGSLCKFVGPATLAAVLLLSFFGR
jgi:hypothetical protein